MTPRSPKAPEEFCAFVKDALGGEVQGTYRCGALSAILARMLQLGGYKAECRHGEIQGTGHVWVVCEGQIFDPTAGQFKEEVKYPEGEVWNTES